LASASTIAVIDVRPQQTPASAGIAPVYWSDPPVGRVSSARAKVPASVPPTGAVAVIVWTSRIGDARVVTFWTSSTSAAVVVIV